MRPDALQYSTRREVGSLATVENLTRIVDLPKGGGANRGADVWFELVTEDGSSHELCLDMGLFSPFVAGLDRFAAEAQKLRAPGTSPPSKPFAAAGTQVLPAADGGLLLRMNSAKAGSFDFVIPRDGIKPLLLQMLRAIAEGGAAG
ncbi:MAG: hypothetical protein JWP35_495 [Caulobacter sp.]|nr:hypothetical protein [Caulobacter sp.]